MFIKNFSRRFYGYKVVKKKTNDGPLPSMTQYFLQSDSGQPLSFWNDIPIDFRNDVVNCVVQIPKQMNGKFQVKKHLPFHPIMQDTRKNIFTNQLELRFYNQFPLFNYGYIPQTWQQMLLKDQLGRLGDDDPIDICDLSEVSKSPGQVFRGKILGGFCLIDQGEIDWKIFVMDQQDCRKSRIDSIDDIDPRRIQSIKKWFKIVKVPDGKKPNTIAYDQKIFSKKQTLEVIKHTSKEWVNLTTNDDQSVRAIRKKHLIGQQRVKVRR